jgi:hypothetical protein
MRTVFADTYYFIALLNERDSAHATVHAFSRAYVGRMVTTEWVLTEVGDALAGESDRSKFINLVEFLRSRPDVDIVRSSGELFDSGVDLFSRRNDKEWSLTDCISFVVMGQYGLKEALTGDRHFQQAGFEALLIEE